MAFPQLAWVVTLLLLASPALADAPPAPAGPAKMTPVDTARLEADIRRVNDLAEECRKQTEPAAAPARKRIELITQRYHLNLFSDPRDQVDYDTGEITRAPKDKPKPTQSAPAPQATPAPSPVARAAPAKK